MKQAQSNIRHFHRRYQTDTVMRVRHCRPKGQALPARLLFPVPSLYSRSLSSNDNSNRMRPNARSWRIGCRYCCLYCDRQFARLSRARRSDIGFQLSACAVDFADCFISQNRRANIVGYLFDEWALWISDLIFRRTKVWSWLILIKRLKHNSRWTVACINDNYTWDGLIIQEKKLSVKWEDEKIR